MSDSWRPRQSQLERLGRAQKSMIPGTLSGRIASAQAVPKIKHGETAPPDVIEAIFSYSGFVIGGEESPPYYNRIGAADVATIIASTRSNPSGSTVIQLKNNGTVIGTITLPSGSKPEIEKDLDDIEVAYGDQLSVVCGSVGTGLEGLTVQVLLEG